MILHVVFLDGSNPYVSLPTDRRTVAQMWRRWRRNHPDTAHPVAYIGDNRVVPAMGGTCYATIYNTPDGTVYRLYKRLGNALAALERMSNK